MYSINLINSNISTVQHNFCISTAQHNFYILTAQHNFYIVELLFVYHHQYLGNSCQQFPVPAPDKVYRGQMFTGLHDKHIINTCKITFLHPQYKHDIHHEALNLNRHW